MIDAMTVLVIFIFVFAITLWTSLIWWAIRNIKNYRKTKKLGPQLFISVVLLAWFSFTTINSVLGWSQPAITTTTVAPTITTTTDEELWSELLGVAPTTTTYTTNSRSQAVKRGASYLRSSSFSRSSLINQLEYEGFSSSDATYGTDAQNANWNFQAVQRATSYLQSSSFSRSSLINQLLFEGFSQSQAEYGVNAVGL